MCHPAARTPLHAATDRQVLAGQTGIGQGQTGDRHRLPTGYRRKGGVQVPRPPCRGLQAAGDALRPPHQGLVHGAGGLALKQAERDCTEHELVSVGADQPGALGDRCARRFQEMGASTAATCWDRINRLWSAGLPSRLASWRAAEDKLLRACEGTTIAPARGDQEGVVHSGRAGMDAGCGSAGARPV